MIDFFKENLITIITVLVLLFLVFLAVRRIILDKRAGIGSCGQKCSECPSRGHCGYIDETEPKKPTDNCNGVCSGCPYSDSCNKNAN